MSAVSRKRVLICFLGGATIDERSQPGMSVSKPSHVAPWLRRMSEMDIIAEPIGLFIAPGTASVGLPEWSKVAQEIVQHQDVVDGVVVIHQLETITAAAFLLSFMLPSLGMPVVVCGSSLVSAEERAHGLQPSGGTEFGAKANFINAVQVAVSDVGEVVVVSGSHIYRGSTVSGSGADIRGAVLGKIDFGIRFFGQQAKRSTATIRALAKFETKVAVIEYLPGIDHAHLTQIRGVKGLFISVPEGVTPKLDAIQKIRQGFSPTLPTILYTQAKLTGLPAPVVLVAAPSRLAAFFKTMWALGQSTDPKRLRKFLA